MPPIGPNAPSGSCFSSSHSPSCLRYPCASRRAGTSAASSVVAFIPSGRSTFSRR
jgi:hypothetical protein